MKKEDEKKIINKTVDYVNNFFKKEYSGHDQWHSLRVRDLAIKLAKNENAKVDTLVLQLAALLHDVDDGKISPETADELKNATGFMKDIGLDESTQKKVCEIIKEVSFKGEDSQPAKSKEGKYVQDADRLDAMGAIGIARIFAYGGNKNREIYNPEIQPRKILNYKDYLKSGSTSVNHFYEKIFLLKEQMNTASGRALADEREQYMRDYLRRFKTEWEEKEEIPPQKTIWKIVITGGPSAGKSSGMDTVKKEFAKLGYAVIVVPETASELIIGGITPVNCENNLAFQRVQFRLQQEKERLFLQGAYSLDEDKVIIIYDRGMIDNLAYMDKKERKKILQYIGENSEESLFRAYDAVFHMQTIAKWSEEEYEKLNSSGNKNNEARTHDAKEAIALDDKTMQAWQGHSVFQVIENAKDGSKDAKLNSLVRKIAAFLEEERIDAKRKYLIELPNLKVLNKKGKKIEIEQIYIKREDRREVKLRRRGIKNDYSYSMIEKIKVKEGWKRSEKKISEREYYSLCENTKEKMILKKDRYYMMYENRYFAVDVFDAKTGFWGAHAVVEVEADEDEEILFPEILKKIADVTDEEKYRNSKIALQLNGVI